MRSHNIFEEPEEKLFAAMAESYVGKDGSSCYAAVEQTQDGATLTVTDARGVTAAQLHHGETGQRGPAGTLAIGTVTAAETGAAPQVHNRGSSTEAILDFVFPRGEKGEKGDTGAPGDAGYTPGTGIEISAENVISAAGALRYTDEKLHGKADQPYFEKTGYPFSCSDSAGGAYGELEVYGNSAQTGTPTPAAAAKISDAAPKKLLLYGKNLLAVGEGAVTDARTGATFTSDGRGHVRVTGTTAYSGGRIATAGLSGRLKLQKGVTYALSISTTVSQSLQVFLNTVGTSVPFQSTTGAPSVFTPDAETEVYIGINVAAGVTYDTTLSIQLETGSAATSFEEYHAPESADLSAAGSLRGVALSKDRIVYSGGAWTKIENIRRLVVDGTTLKAHAVLSDAGTGLYHCLVALGTNNTSVKVPGLNGDLLCSHFRAGKFAAGNAYITPNGMTLVIVHTDQTLTTVEDYNAWFAAQAAAGTPVTVQYQLETPTAQIISIDMPPELPKGSCTIFCDGETESESVSAVRVLYRQDLAAYIKSVESELLDTISACVVDLDSRVSALELQ